MSPACCSCSDAGLLFGGCRDGQEVAGGPGSSGWTRQQREESCACALRSEEHSTALATAHQTYVKAWVSQTLHVICGADTAFCSLKIIKNIWICKLYSLMFTFCMLCFPFKNNLEYGSDCVLLWNVKVVYLQGLLVGSSPVTFMNLVDAFTKGRHVFPGNWTYCNTLTLLELCGTVWATGNS